MKVNCKKLICFMALAICCCCSLLVIRAGATTPWYNIESRHFKIEATRDPYTGNISPENLRRFLSVLDDAYDAGVELIGRPPANGEKIKLIDTYTDTNPSDWAFLAALGGNTIWCPANSYAQILRHFNSEGKIDFILFHELGHIFTVDHRFNVSGELLAHFIGLYMVSQLDVVVHSSVGYWDGRHVNIEGKGAEFVRKRIDYELEWAVNAPDPSNLLWLIYTPVLDAYGYQPFIDTFHNYVPGGYADFVPSNYRMRDNWIPNDAVLAGDAVIRAHRFMETLSHFTPGGLESVVPREVLDRFDRVWPVIKLQPPPPPPAEPVPTLTNFTKTNSYTTGTFTDIDDAWYTDWVKRAFDYGIISGVGNNRFDPDGNLTGAQALTIGARIHSVYKYGSEGEEKIQSFKRDGDVWYDMFVLYAKAEGLVGNEFDGKMDTPITRAEMVLAWSKILEPKDMTTQNTVNSLPDVNANTQYRDAVMLFYRAGIVGGVDDAGTFRPSNNITRAEAATIFMRLIDMDSRSSGKTFGEQ
jgi:hypothetical protein